MRRPSAYRQCAMRRYEFGPTSWCSAMAGQLLNRKMRNISLTTLKASLVFLAHQASNACRSNRPLRRKRVVSKTYYPEKGETDRGSTMQRLGAGMITTTSDVETL